MALGIVICITNRTPSKDAASRPNERIGEKLSHSVPFPPRRHSKWGKWPRHAIPGAHIQIHARHSAEMSECKIRQFRFTVALEKMQGKLPGHTRSHPCSLRRQQNRNERFLCVPVRLGALLCLYIVLARRYLRSDSFDNFPENVRVHAQIEAKYRIIPSTLPSIGMKCSSLTHPSIGRARSPFR